MTPSLTDQQQSDEQFWAELDEELRQERMQELDYIHSLSEEEYYKQYILPTQDDEGDELAYEYSIGVI